MAAMACLIVVLLGLGLIVRLVTLKQYGTALLLMAVASFAIGLIERGAGWSDVLFGFLLLVGIAVYLIKPQSPKQLVLRVLRAVSRGLLFLLSLPFRVFGYLIRRWLQRLTNGHHGGWRDDVQAPTARPRRPEVRGPATPVWEPREHDDIDGLGDRGQGTVEQRGPDGSGPAVR